MRKACGIIPPRRWDIIGRRSDGYMGECVLSRHHSSEEHLLQTPEGKCFMWKDDDKCKCCSPEEDDRCYLFWEISKKEAEKIIRRQK